MNTKSTAGLVCVAVFRICAEAGTMTQCDFANPGNFTDTQFDSAADCNDGYDDNGGWNEPDSPFLEAGTHAPGDFFRVKGVVGTYDGECSGGGDTRRDLDWIRFHVNEPCYITVTLSMADRFGTPLDGTDAHDLLFIQQGSGQGASTFLYGDYGLDGCPHVAVYTFPDGSQQTRFPVNGPDDILVIVSTPFAPAGNNLLYHGPMPYGLDVSLTAYDHPACLAATNDCVTVSASGGCADGFCCDYVCSYKPECCNVAWDESCVDEGAVGCNLCDLNPCCPSNPALSNDCMESAELVTSLPAYIEFDCTGATTDGPNSPALCSSDTSRDLWYVVGPAPYSCELLVTMCGQGNTGDAVISVFDLGDRPYIDSPGELPSRYVACRDDTCDDDGDGTVDEGGPAGINLIGVPAGEYILVRVGRFLDPDRPLAPGFAGTMQLSYRAVLVDHGLQSAVKNAGSDTNLGLISGYATSTNTRRWMMVPFDMTVSGTVDGFDFAAFDSTGPDQVNWKVIARDTGDASYGDFARPFGDGNYVADQVIASGLQPLDINAPVNVGDDFQQRYFIDIANPFQLDPGSYYFTCYGSRTDGAPGGSFAWLLYGRKGMPQTTTAAVHIPIEDAANTAAGGYGDFPAGTPFGWRGIGSIPRLCFYNLGPAYAVQPGDNPALLYNCAFNLKGQLASSSCFGDLDGSGEVDSGDVGFALLDFGPCPGCVSDLDGSGEVDSGDIGLILLSYGPCP